jgi:hypothetical protein
LMDVQLVTHDVPATRLGIGRHHRLHNNSRLLTQRRCEPCVPPFHHHRDRQGPRHAQRDEYLLAKWLWSVLRCIHSFRTEAELLLHRQQTSDVTEIAGEVALYYKAYLLQARRASHRHYENYTSVQKQLSELP